MEEQFFSDISIVEQSAAMVQCPNGVKTNGVSLLVECQGGDAVEIVLLYEELKAALADLEADRLAMPHLYTSNGD